MRPRSTPEQVRSRVSPPAAERFGCDNHPVSKRPSVVELLSSSIALRQLAVWVVLLISVVQFAGPVEALVSQRVRVAALRDEVSQRKTALAELKLREEKLKDPNYVKILARARLHFVMPKETAYIVLGAMPDAGGELPLDTDVVAAAAQQPWWVTLHETMASTTAVGEP